jgi:hypothetical protein
MDHINILKRAWEILWRYRALWIFGIIVALTTTNPSTGNPGGDGGGQVQYKVDEEDFEGFPLPGEVFPFPEGEFPVPAITPQVIGALVAVGVGLACLVLILTIAATVAKYVATTALIRMVDDYEKTGEKRSIRGGFRLGWSRTAWRLFLINLVIKLPVLAVFILLLVLVGSGAALSVLMIDRFSTVCGVTGLVASIGLFFVFLLPVIGVVLVLTLLRPFFFQACALEGLGVGDSIRRGFGIVRQHLKDTGVMWLIMIGVRIAFTIVMTLVMILAVFLGLVAGGVPALLLGGLLHLILKGAAGWILAAAVGVPIFILVVAAPALFLGGLMEVFKSNVWTLTFRELRAIDSADIVDVDRASVDPTLSPEHPATA